LEELSLTQHLGQGFNDVYIVLDLMGTDLQRLIDSKIELDDRKIKHIVYQITLGLIRMHTAKVLHRDLKPGNILIDAEWNVKIADLGLATGEGGGNLTEYVVTRWYRSPELLLGMKDYGEGVDIWR
jgi:serine/threonine protein kinase